MGCIQRLVYLRHMAVKGKLAKREFVHATYVDSSVLMMMIIYGYVFWILHLFWGLGGCNFVNIQNFFMLMMSKLIIYINIYLFIIYLYVIKIQVFVFYILCFFVFVLRTLFIAYQKNFVDHYFIFRLLLWLQVAWEEYVFMSAFGKQATKLLIILSECMVKHAIKEMLKCLTLIRVRQQWMLW